MIETPIVDVLRLTGQPEPRGRRFARSWAGSTDQNCSISGDGLKYFCHSTGSGGDAVSLYREITGANVRDALTALEAAGLRTPARQLSPIELAEQQRRRGDADRHRLAVADFRAALDAELNRLKFAAAEADDDAALEAAASLQYRLTQAPEAVFAEMLVQDGGRVQWLIAQGREDRQHAAAVTRLAVDLLARAEGREVAHVA